LPNSPASSPTGRRAISGASVHHGVRQSAKGFARAGFSGGAQRKFLFGTSALIPLVVVFLMIVTFWVSFTDGHPSRSTVYSLRNYIAIYTDPFTITALSNTAVFALISTAVALSIGAPIAWLAERTTMSHKPWLYGLMVLNVVMPSFFVGIGWILMLHPRIGFVNVWLRNLTGTRDISINITTIAGMGIVQGLSLASLAFIMTAAAFRAMNPVLEEAAAVHGMRTFTILRKITLPLLMPAMAAAAIYIFVIGLAAFDIPAVLGLANRVYTFSTFLYQITINSDASPNYGIPAAVGLMMLIFALLMTLWYSRFLRAAERYEIVSGKSYRTKKIEISKLANRTAWAFCCLFLLLTIGVPLLLMIWVSLVPYVQAPSWAGLKHLSLKRFADLDWATFGTALKNSVLLMVLAPAATIVCALPLAWVVTRSRSAWRYIYEFLTFLPHAMPPIIFGLAALLAALFVFRDTLPLYGTVWIIAIVYIVEGIAFVSRVINSSMLQIHRELDEVGYVSGLGLLSVLRHVTLPLLFPTLLGVWLWRALVTYRELTVAGTLFTPDNITLPVMAWNLWTSGGTGAAAAVTLMIVLILTPFIMLYWVFVGRRIMGW
jgi:iron(III) transport system permease protein